MTRILHIFQPEIQAAIKVTLVMALVSAYVITFAWGYEGRQEARRWRELACSYRVSELERVTPGLADGRGACNALDRIGMSPMRDRSASARWSAALGARVVGVGMPDIGRIGR
jgi:hypothetical protein